MHEALLGTPTRSGRIRCGLCPNACIIAEGERGVCGARGVVDGKLQALTYGMVSSYAADPIEKKPLFHVMPGSRVFSVGSVGCSMRCGHCQNWRISRIDEGARTTLISPEHLVDLAEETRCEALAWTYNEPTIWLEYVLDSGRIARARGLVTVMVTNGYVTSEALDLFADVVDVWRVDIKGFSEETYRHLCRVGGPDIVRSSTERALHVHGMHVECVTNVVPGVNDSTEELDDIARWIKGSLSADVPWHVTRAVPYLDFADLPPTPLSTLERARNIGQAAGLHYVYLGNVDVEGGEDTVCPRCGAVAVERSGFSSDTSGLTPRGACAVCALPLAMLMREHGEDACRSVGVE